MSKLDLWVALLVARTEHLAFRNSAKRPREKIMGSLSEILGLIVGVATKITGEGVVCGLNLVWWEILYTDFQRIDRNNL